MSETANQSQTNKQKKSAQRKRLRAARRSLSSTERSAADKLICTHLLRLHAFRQARTVAAFLAFDGEPSVAALLADRRNARKNFLVPVLQSGQMHFAPLIANRRLRRNGFGIAEPSHRTRVNSRAIDVVLVPLVGFDTQGNRLGMGGGYYDRHFNYLQNRQAWLRPRLIGVAYELQRVPVIPADPWDVPLHGIVTNAGFRKT